MIAQVSAWDTEADAREFFEEYAKIVIKSIVCKNSDSKIGIDG